MLDLIIGFAVALLSGLGIGGGGLLVIWLVLGKNADQLGAQGINLVFFLFSSGAAMLRHMTRRRLDFKLITFLSAFGAIGALIGAFAARTADPELIRTLFGILLLISGIFALTKG